MQGVNSVVQPADHIWATVELMKSKLDLTDADLAEVAGVSDRTVRSDRENPSKIPISRLMAYLSIITTPIELYDAICDIVSENLSR